MCPFRHKEIEKEKEDSTDTEIKVIDLESFEMEDFENVEDSKSPTNKEFVCDECKNTSQCVECFVNQNIQTEDWDNLISTPDRVQQVGVRLGFHHLTPVLIVIQYFAVFC